MIKDYYTKGKLYGLDKYSKILAKKKHKLKRLFKRKDWMAYHGIERSGSNYICACLIFINIDLINLFTPPKWRTKGITSPMHKHYRWYPNKELIPNHRKGFINDKIVENIKEINSICGYPEDTRHIVIRKSPLNAVTSIANHGLRMKWFEDKKDAENNIESIAKDYEAYYDFWQNMSDLSPSLVQVILYEDLYLSSEPLINALKKVDLLPKVKIPKKFIFERVEQSSKNRSNFFSKEDIKNIVSIF